MNVSEPQSAKRRARSRWIVALIGLFVGSLLIVVAVSAALWWMYTTPSGLRFVVLLNSRLNTSVVVGDVSGSLRDGFAAGTLSVKGPTWSLQATEIVVEPYELRWRQRLFDFERVGVRTATLDWVPSGEPAQPPQSLATPIDLRVRNLAIGELRFGERGNAQRAVNDIAADLRLNADAVLIERGALQYGPSQVALTARVDARSPFALRADAQITSTLLDHGVAAKVRASHTLLDAFVEIEADSSDARAQITARLTPFAAVPLAQLNADVAHFNPAAWFDGAPTMRLRGRSDLKPVSTGTSANAAFSLEGPFSVENLDAGPIDKQRIPVRSARGDLTWSANMLTLALQRVEGIRGAASGGLTWSATTGVNAKLSLTGIDLSTIYSTATPTRIDGILNYVLLDHSQRFTGTLRTDSAFTVGKVRGLELAADFNLLLRDNVLNVETARLRIADGTAELRGRVELHGSYATRANGKFDKLDLGRLVKGLDTRLNGTIELDARFKPTIIGRGAIALADSQLMGRAIDGRATVALADQRIDVDVNVASRSARLTASGSLGAGRELTFELIAPQLAEVLPRTSGSVTARGTASGEFSAPQLRAEVTASDLKFANGQTVDSIVASITGGTAASAPLAVMIKLTGHRAPNPDASLATASLIARGVTSDHTLELNGTTVSRQPVRIVANGGWSVGPAQTYGWRGTLSAAESGMPLQLRLSEPTRVVIEAGSLMFGPARFDARGTQFSAVEVQLRDGKWRTSGTFDGLKPQALDARSTAARRVVRTGSRERPPLTLRGRWELELAEALSGVVIVERTGGDIYGGIDALNPVGISDLGAAISVLNNRVTGTAYVRGKALGRLDATIDAYVDTSGGVQIARTRPFRIDIDAVLPDLSWMGPLIGDSVQVEGSGSIKTVISGTPAEPTASGPIRATGLRIAYVEQGLRLEDGTLDANLEDGVLVVNEIVFTGRPRVAPDDKRAAEDVSFDSPGRLRAQARIALRTLTGSVGIRADRLPVLQRRDRWMVVSGEGGITLAPAHADMYAKLRVDGAYIDFSRLRGARSLPNDVVIVRAEQPAKADTAVEVTMNIRGDLGSRFYIRGAGLEARLDGALDIEGRPGQLLAEGNVRTRGGTYQGYGQRLQIQRGILTFQGPIENPALNVLAVRTGLPVDVGVSIAGTAARPIVRLYSDPSMTDVEKLNWLVLGRPPGAAGDGGQERALLSAAATALFAGQVDSSSATLMQSLGIDEISLRPGQDSASILPRETVAGTLRSATGTTAASDFVAIGKRLSDDLYLTFEQAITGASTYVALNYQISRRLSLIGRAGTTTALDLVYSIAFD
ncbi:MAG TPA: translocation/assembly module TamB domain-containing protein [Burkholderiaceae bacterium]|nr:translocation/assembly module TamB domain-containing protein [Burkholderiaceae bacterium]